MLINLLSSSFKECLISMAVSLITFARIQDFLIADSCFRLVAYAFYKVNGTAEYGSKSRPHSNFWFGANLCVQLFEGFLNNEPI